MLLLASNVGSMSILNAFSTLTDNTSLTLLEYARYLESADSLQCTQKSVVCLPLSI